MWDECNCAIVWAFFGIAFLWDWNENWHFPVLWPLLSFPNLLTYWVQQFHSIIFQDWNSSTGIPSPPLTFFIVMLFKAHLISHSRMSGSRWLHIPGYLALGEWSQHHDYFGHEDLFCTVLLCILATSSWYLLMNYGMRFVTLYRRQRSRPSPWKRNEKKQNGCLRRPYK